MPRWDTAQLLVPLVILLTLTLQAQISLLSRQFPASPRVVLLHGLAFEAAGDSASARLVYQVLLGTCKEPEKAIELGTIVKGLDKEGDECFIVSRDHVG